MRKYTLCQVENVIFELLCLSGGQNLSIESPSRIVLVLDRPKKVLRRKIRICACAYPRLLWRIIRWDLQLCTRTLHSRRVGVGEVLNLSYNARQQLVQMTLGSG